MTLILGVNLSDKIYLAADSLISRKVGNKYEPAGYCTKLISMSGKDHMPHSSFSCMFSGNKSFADYLFRRMDQALDINELSTDINDLISKIDLFMKKVVPEYTGSPVNRVVKIIFAGCSNAPNSVKRFKLENLNKALGPEAGYIDDAHVVQGIQLGFVSVPDQKIFSYVIDDRANQFGIEEVGEMYSVICGGSKKLTEQEKHALLKHFLSKRAEEDEAKDIVNFLRRQFSDTIGGAITLGVIDYRKRLIYFGYDVAKTGKYHHSNWSVKLDDKGLMATDPDGREHNLIDGFYNLTTDKENEKLEL